MVSRDNFEQTRRTVLTNDRSGGDKDSFANQRKSDGRCNIKRDSGYTKADKVRGSYFCIYFAKGLCINGKNCEYLHRLPTISDIFPPNVDCFGRDKHSDYRDDMGGVGSFLKQNRTLYVGRMHVLSQETKMEEIVSKHFSEWGDIERIRVLNDRGVAFVTYVTEANAQFAKEAMAHQSLENDEVLNVRWATEDPNPHAQKREKRRLEEQAAEAIKRLLPASYVAELEGRHRDAKRLKEEEDREIDETRLLEQAKEDEEEDPIPDEEEAPQERSSGIISEDVLQQLQQISQIRPSKAPQRANLLGNYDSDSDSDV